MLKININGRLFIAVLINLFLLPTLSLMSIAVQISIPPKPLERNAYTVLPFKTSICPQSFSTESVDEILKYRAELDKKLYLLLSFLDKQPAKPIIGFEVLTNGTLANMKILKSSGKADIDKQALGTIESIFPYKPLPESYPFSKNEVVLSYTQMTFLQLSNEEQKQIIQNNKSVIDKL